MTDSSQQLHARAQNALGEARLYGKGVEKDEREAAFWFEKAERQGLADAKNHLGVMHCYGKGGLKKDEKRAENLFMDAAAYQWPDLGFATAQYNLGLIYAKRAAARSAASYSKNVQEQQQKLLRMVHKANLSVEDDTIEDIKDAKKWFKAAASQKFADAQYALGVLCENKLEKLENEDYLHHTTVQRDPENAKVLIGGAADSSGSHALFGAAGLTGRSNDDPLKWYTDAAEQGHFKARQGIREFADPDKKNNDDAQCCLGWLYENGIGLERSKENAVKWYKKSAKQGNANAQFSLGMMYARNEGVPENMEEADRLREAARLLKDAAKHKQAHVYAQYELGRMCQNGRGVKKDLEEARVWLSKAERLCRNRLRENGHREYEKLLNVIRLAKEQVEEDL